MPKYEYCVVGLEMKWEPTINNMVTTGNGVKAANGKEVIAEGVTYLEVFNKLGAAGWHLVLNHNREELPVYYFEREIKEG